MGTLADILIPLAGSISNEKALKMREACDALEAKIDIAQRGSNYAHDLISSLTERVTELECDNLDRRLTKLESAVDVLDRERVETLNLRVNGLESMVLELGDATKNIAVATDETLRAVRLNTGEGEEARGACGSGAFQPHPSRTEAASASAGDAREKVSATHTPPSPASVPAWVPSEDEIAEAMRATHSPRPGAYWLMPASMELKAIRRLIASRAPAAPVVDVRRLVFEALLPGLGDVEVVVGRMTRALAAQGVRTKDGAP